MLEDNRRILGLMSSPRGYRGNIGKKDQGWGCLSTTCFMSASDITKNVRAHPPSIPARPTCSLKFVVTLRGFSERHPSKPRVSSLPHPSTDYLLSIVAGLGGRPFLPFPLIDSGGTGELPACLPSLPRLRVLRCQRSHFRAPC